MPDVVTIRECVQRAKADGLPVSEYTVRAWVRTGAIPARKIGAKTLIYYPNLVRFLQCADGCDNSLDTVGDAQSIRRVDV